MTAPGHPTATRQLWCPSAEGGSRLGGDSWAFSWGAAGWVATAGRSAEGGSRLGGDSWAFSCGGQPTGCGDSWVATAGDPPSRCPSAAGSGIRLACQYSADPARPVFVCALPPAGSSLVATLSWPVSCPGPPARPPGRQLWPLTSAPALEANSAGWVASGCEGLAAQGPRAKGSCIAGGERRRVQPAAAATDLGPSRQSGSTGQY